MDYTNVCLWDRHFYFNKAAKRWSQVIVEDVPDVEDDFSGFPDTDCGPYPRNIDDIYICASYEPIDPGTGGIVAIAMPTIFRDNQMAIAGFMK